MKHQILGFLLIFISSLGFGAMGSISNFAFREGVNVQTLLTFRFGMAAVVFWVIILITKIKFRISINQLILLIILGIMGYAVMSKLLYSSFQHVDVSVAVLVFYSYPVLVYVISILLRIERITVRKVGSLMISFIGLIMVVQSESGFNSKGIQYSFLAAIIYAAFITISNYRLSSSSSFVNSAYISLFASLALFISGFFQQSLSYSFSIFGWGMIMLLAFVSTIIPLICFFGGLKILGATKSSIISLTEPVFAVLLSTILLEEYLEISQWFGIALIIISSIVLNIKFSRVKGIKFNQREKMRSESYENRINQTCNN